MKKILALIILVISLTSGTILFGKKHSVTPLSSPPELYIGDTLAGGIVFYIAPMSRVGNNIPHGLVCSPVVQSGGIAWCRGKCERVNGLVTSVGMDTTGTLLPGGKSNTNAIVKMYGNVSYAANMCKTLDLNGYTDWYLPSKDELNLMYENLKRFDIGHFANGYYWSSSEYNTAAKDTNLVWAQFFGNGKQYQLPKNYAGYVRAVRTF